MNLDGRTPRQSKIRLLSRALWRHRATGAGTRQRLGYALLTPLAVLALVLVVVPIGTFFVYSFLKPGVFLRTEPGITLDNYSQALTNQIYRRAEINSLQIGLTTAFFAIILGYILAYYLSFKARRWKQPMLAATVASILGVYLIRIYAWRTILGTQGIWNSTLETIGVEGLGGIVLFSKAAVVIALVNFYIPFATLVLFAALENIPREQLEAARDLGASPFATFRRVTLPLSGPACFYAFVFVFFLSAADFVTPQLLGGAAGSTIGSVVANQFILAGNWPLGAALSFVLVGVLAIVLVLVWLAMRTAGLMPRRS